MTDFVTLEEAKDYSRIQHTALDNTIDLLIQAACAAVSAYLKSASPYQVELDDDGEPLVDSNGIVYVEDSNGPLLHPQVKLATLYLVDMYLKNKQVPMADGDLPLPAKNLLYPLRDPAFR